MLKWSEKNYRALSALRNGNDNFFPRRWRDGRILQIHPRSDLRRGGVIVSAKTITVAHHERTSIDLMIRPVHHVANEEIRTLMPTKRFVVLFTNGNATCVMARSVAAAKRMTQGSLDQFGYPRKVRSIREVAIRLTES